MTEGGPHPVEKGLVDAGPARVQTSNESPQTRVVGRTDFAALGRLRRAKEELFDVRELDDRATDVAKLVATLS